MMAPYAIAHMRIGLKLAEHGYSFAADQRARIYLTNALEGPQNFSDRLAFDAPALAHEAHAVNIVKRQHRFTILLGNPPYSNFGQLNTSEFILTLLDDYKRGLHERKINLDDDYIKFVRLCEHILARAGAGICGLITNNSYLDGVTHRQMRKHLSDRHTRIWLLNLHGSATLRERCPDGSVDENVFDIRQGVSIAFLLKAEDDSDGAAIEHLDLWGTREHKQETLSRTRLCDMSAGQFRVTPPYHFFVPKDFSARAEYDCFLRLRDLFVVDNTGIQTKRDALTIHFTPQELCHALNDVMALAEGELRARYHLPEDGRDWQVAAAKADVGQELDESMISRILYRPFDWRWTYFTGTTKGFLAYPRRDTMRDMLKPNRALVTVRLNGAEDDFVALVADGLVEKGSLPRGNYSVFPLYHYAGEPDDGESLWQEQRVANVGSAALLCLAGALGIGVNESEFRENVTPESIFDYTYAVLHSRAYRSRYAAFLEVEFPRVPVPSSLTLFREMAAIGSKLVKMHLMDWVPLDRAETHFVGQGAPPLVEKVSYSKGTVWLDKARTFGFEGVPEEVWGFCLGGYQVCKKWLKDRQAKGGKNPGPGRVLTDEHIDHYQRIVVAIHETIRLMGEIDDVIEEHGGWPDAFVTEPLDDGDEEAPGPFP
jgi:predicted helicase